MIWHCKFGLKVKYQSDRFSYREFNSYGKLHVPKAVIIVFTVDEQLASWKTTFFMGHSSDIQISTQLLGNSSISSFEFSSNERIISPKILKMSFEGFFFVSVCCMQLYYRRAEPVLKGLTPLAPPLLVQYLVIYANLCNKLSCSNSELYLLFIFQT